MRLDPDLFEAHWKLGELLLRGGQTAAAQEQRFHVLLAKGFATNSQYDDALKSLQSAQAAVQATGANQLAAPPSKM